MELELIVYNVRTLEFVPNATGVVTLSKASVSHAEPTVADVLILMYAPNAMQHILI